MALYSQQKIEVVVHGYGGGGGEGETPGMGGGGGGGGLVERLTGSSSATRQKRILVTNLTHTLAATKQISLLAINYTLGGIAYETGDEALQNNVQQQMEIVTDVTGMASSVAMGAIYGAWGGPIGSVIGATLAAVTTGTSTAVKYLGKARDFSYKTFKENNGIEYQRARAGVNLTTGRLR